MKTILVTGGCGFVGSELVRHLFNDTNYKIVVVDKLYFGRDSIKDIINNGRVIFFKYDIRNITGKDKVFKGVDTVIHLAALSNDASAELDPQATMDINVDSTRRILDMCVKHNIKKFIFASTSSIYGFNDDVVDETAAANPLSTYGKSKLSAENIIKVYSRFIKDICILRLATLFGYSKRFRTDLVVNTMIKSAILKNEITIHGSGSQYRPLIHVKDLAGIIILLINNDRLRCETYNIGHFNISVSDLAERIGDIFGQLYYKKVSINKIASEIADKRNYNVSNKKFLNEYNYKFRHNLEDTVDEIYKAYNAGEIPYLDNPIYDNAEWLKQLIFMEKYIKNIKGKIL